MADVVGSVVYLVKLSNKGLSRQINATGSIIAKKMAVISTTVGAAAGQNFSKNFQKAAVMTPMGMRKVAKPVTKTLADAGKKGGKRAGSTFSTQFTRTVIGKLNVASRRISNVIGGVIGYGILSRARTEWRSFEDALRQSSVVSRGTVDLKKLRQEAYKLSEALGFDASTSLKGFYQAVSSKFSSKEATELSKAGAILSAAAKEAGEMINPEKSTEAIATVLNTFYEFDDRMNHVKETMDTFVNTVTFGKGGITKLANSIAILGPAAAKMGLSFEQTLIPVAALTQQGFKMEMAMTSLSQALRMLSDPTTEAGKILFKEYGMYFSQAIKSGESLVGVFQKLADTVAFREYAKKVDDEVKEMGENLGGGSGNEMLQSVVGNQRAIRSILALTGAGVKKVNEITKDFKKNTNATRKALDLYVKSSLTRYDRMMAALTNKVLSFIDAMGGMHNILVMLAWTFAAFKIAGFLSQLTEAIYLFQSLAVAKAAAAGGGWLSGVAVAKTVAALGVGMAAVKAGFGIYAASTISSSHADSSKVPRNIYPGNPGDKDKMRVIVHNSPTGTNVLVNGKRTNAQTNYGGS